MRNIVVLMENAKLNDNRTVKVQSVEDFVGLLIQEVDHEEAIVIMADAEQVVKDLVDNIHLWETIRSAAVVADEEIIPECTDEITMLGYDNTAHNNVIIWSPAPMIEVGEDLPEAPTILATSLTK